MPEYKVMSSSSLDKYQQLVQYNKEKLIELWKQLIDNHYENFKQTDVCSKMVNLNRSFTYTEQKILEQEIQCYFEISQVSEISKKLKSTLFNMSIFQLFFFQYNFFLCYLFKKCMKHNF
jgi:hypothetical protein